ncbi:hypothetical protein AKO1_015328 [Acrasis kona]|uniref:Uncharacterized protein n=1 Tax=Acrasis kona TaxID=1008807 RepID=A0AAW2YYI1_9EUKA
MANKRKFLLTCIIVVISGIATFNLLFYTKTTTQIIQLTHANFNCKDIPKTDYQYNDPQDLIRTVDVVIPSHEKDREVLERCVAAAKKYIKNIGRVIVVSKNKMTDNAEFYPEHSFPFSYKDIEMHLIKHRVFSYWPSCLKLYLKSPKRAGWYLSQLIKLYAAVTIPNVSNDVLVLDSDTMFTKPITFTFGKDGAYIGVTNNECFESYVNHAKRLLPELQNTPTLGYSGIVHHQLTMKDVMAKLIQTVEKHHGLPFWKAFMMSADLGCESNIEASEYEVGLLFALHYFPERTRIRKMVWANDERTVPDNLMVDPLPDQFKEYGDMVSVHHYRRPWI